MSQSADTVNAFLKAMNEENFTEARRYTADDMQFEGVMGTRDGAEAYFKDMEHMKLKYAVKRMFEDGDDVSVFYDITMSGKEIFSSGWYHVTDGKIQWFKVLFDPRPLLDNKK